MSRISVAYVAYTRSPPPRNGDMSYDVFSVTIARPSIPSAPSAPRQAATRLNKGHLDGGQRLQYSGGHIPALVPINTASQNKTLFLPWHPPSERRFLVQG